MKIIMIGAHEGFGRGVACLVDDIDPVRSYEHELHEQTLLNPERNTTCKKKNVEVVEIKYATILNVSIEGQVAEQVKAFKYIACIVREEYSARQSDMKLNWTCD